ncbi:SDR family oxidoreductase [Ketobacter sp. MCCC 1A13808]|uniref:SDR family oxidoreductase n=1 Tax=Ketobacter sp. MCCC 1A13808 TaxID=2602738 RepID=UPI000F1F31C8|nr:SDR family oxidoreductase [Ketobacter sp. MCCC 1A13808]MVF14359.1 SDR family oxidoreductase [Ketobacter sp. MCCC 1A13808]RLP55874.1 MAG: SDR family oxidoreductase [Ketobacter sp.]
MDRKNQHFMQDPRSQYDLSETKYDSSQPDPGLDTLLQPKADHGERSYKGSGRLTGRKALITGGDSGIGRAVAIAFAREGADLVLTYLESEETDGKETEQYLADSGVKVCSIVGDISNEEFCKELVHFAVDRLGSIDILVNNAAQQYYVEKLADLTSEQFQKTYATNVFSMFWITKAAVPHMPKGSSIINTTSIQSYQPSAGLLDYASSKSAITGFTKSLAKMLINEGIRVNAVAPGPIWTPLQQSGGQRPEKIENFGQGVPMGRPGQPAELAPMYVYLASQESSYVTAEVMGVTGGGHLP